MQLKAVMQALGEGKKVRNLSWGEGEFIHIKHNEICDEQNKTFYLDFNDCDDEWEIYA